jgi:hypothetical protein
VKVTLSDGQEVTLVAFYGECDKCGLPVDQNDNALVIDAALSNDLFLIFAQPRHLLASETCPGSPSRAQYLEGQPRDDRGYGYDERLEAPIRAIHAKMQEWTPDDPLGQPLRGTSQVTLDKPPRDV